MRITRSRLIALLILPPAIINWLPEGASDALVAVPSRASTAAAVLLRPPLPGATYSPRSVCSNVPLSTKSSSPIVVGSMWSNCASTE